MNLSILLQAAPGGSGMQSMLFIVAIFFIMYFFMIRPQMKKAKDEKKFVESVQKGDKVITIGGVHGKIVEIADTTFLIEVDRDVRLRVQRSAISAEATKSIAKAEGTIAEKK